MALLIDGYNLMHAASIVGHGRGKKSLERSRLALLSILAESLTPEIAAQTIVVFDAQNAPPGLPRTMTHRGITVQFAESYEDADELLEELIERDTSPRKLTVVSSDHRLHRAAKRRKAQPIDSDRWFAAALRERFARKTSEQAVAEARSTGPLSSSEVAYWLRTFGITEESLEQPDAADIANPRGTTTEANRPSESVSNTPQAESPDIPSKPGRPRQKTNRHKPHLNAELQGNQAPPRKSRRKKRPQEKRGDHPYLDGGDIFPPNYCDGLEEP